MIYLVMQVAAGRGAGTTYHDGCREERCVGQQLACKKDHGPRYRHVESQVSSAHKEQGTSDRYNEAASLGAGEMGRGRGAGGRGSTS